MATIRLCFFLFSFAAAHLEMSWPYPLRSRFDPATPQSMIDYNMKGPLQASGADFPCKGYQANTPQNMVITYSAGSSYNMTVDGSASHNGGSCQLSLSYDQGKTFKVIKSMIGGCPLEKTYGFTIPEDAPAGHALFAWTWSNFMGNREFYMNCASVHIATALTRREVKSDATAFADRPNIWVADLASVNSCRTDGPTGSLNAVYPNPGSDVEYGGGMSSSSPPTPGNCEIPMIARQVLAPSFSYSPETSISTAYSSQTSLTTTTSPDSSTSSNLYSSFSTASGSASLLSTPSGLLSSMMSASSEIPSMSTAETGTMTTSSRSDSASSTARGSSSLSTVTMTMDCPSTITVTLPPIMVPATYTTLAPASACTGTTAYCPCNTGYSCIAIATCEWACIAMPMTSIRSFTTLVSTTNTKSAIDTSAMAVTTPTSATTAQAETSLLATSTSAIATPQTGGAPTYADRNNLQAYLPCVPGTFICTDSQTWYTCDQQVAGGWIYQYPRQAAAGMQCSPHLTPSGSNPQNGQQGETAPGYYRDDQYVRAAP